MIMCVDQRKCSLQCQVRRAAMRIQRGKVRYGTGFRWCRTWKKSAAADLLAPTAAFYRRTRPPPRPADVLQGKVQIQPLVMDYNDQMRCKYHTRSSRTCFVRNVYTPDKTSSCHVTCYDKLQWRRKPLGFADVCII